MLSSVMAGVFCVRARMEARSSQVFSGVNGGSGKNALNSGGAPSPRILLRALSPSAETTGERDLLGVKYGGDDRKSYPGVRVTAWQTVGGYAVAFAFSDGHKTGIYSYEYLRAIAREIE